MKYNKIIIIGQEDEGVGDRLLLVLDRALNPPLASTPFWRTVRNEAEAKQNGGAW